ncbi:unnamed protein product [Tuber aestivum]|uniref:Protein kinase domain-containing protein n=1 Tax=Tuber aestivum TaxID=59557 RepID=A0A292PXW6_9PEZI|nr:unnamed protein product [Tuber aestivum]
MSTNSKTEELRRQILNRQLVVLNERRFFPDYALKQVVTRDAVTGVIMESGIERHDHTTVIDRILGGAQKIFCILVCIRHVNSITILLRCGIQDAKLALSREELQSDSIGLESHLADEFYQQQWSFIAPIFKSGVQKLPKSCILPFKEERVLAEGGCGALLRVVLYRSHQELVSSDHESGDTVVVARKRIKRISAISRPEKDFENERGPLEFLRQLGHPHIIELLGSYHQEDDYNFFFPLADGSLQDLFEKGHQHFKIGPEGFYSSIVGLSSAINHIHNFTCESGGTNDNYKGYHRDLKPGNILIQQGKLIISDFGLSKFKEDAFPSSTIHRFGTEAYLPPEACDLSPESTFEDQTVGRGVDIWAFGCILAEIATYLLLRPEGVGEFRTKRTTRVHPNVVDNSFHAHNQVKEEVNEWLKHLEELAERDSQISRLVQLARKTLIPDRKERPTAQVVLDEVSALHPENAEYMKLLAWKQPPGQKQEVSQTDKYQDVDMILGPSPDTLPPAPSGLRPPRVPNRRPAAQSSFLSEPSPVLGGSSLLSEPSPVLGGSSLLSEPSPLLGGSSFMSEQSQLWKRNPGSH